jgi:hypothetical protein
MRESSVANVGLVALAVLSAGVVVSRVAEANPGQCISGCSETKYVKLCTLGTYTYYTKPTCSLCNKNVLSNCDDRSMPINCVEKTDDKMKIKAIMSSEFCPCTGFSYAEANPVMVDEVFGDEHNRWKCEPEQQEEEEEPPVGGD